MLTAAEVKAFNINFLSGIKVHRWIDYYTDHHPVILNLNQNLATDLGRYASVATDIYFDYFLSVKWTMFCDTEPLDSFCKRHYAMINDILPHLPKRIHRKISDMISNNWLESFGNRETLGITFKYLKQRATFDNNFGIAVDILNRRYFEIEAAFMEFFPELTAYTKLRLEEV